MSIVSPLLRAGFPILLSLLTVCQLSAADYFWIGGTGNWSDISHWATTSGGATTHSQAPGADDDVFFDANSFTGPGQTVTLNTDIIFCRNMLWAGVTGNPTLIGPAPVTINVFGSWQLEAGMTYEFYGTTVFSGSLDNTIDYANYPAGLSVVFGGTGSWTLDNVLSCDSTLALNEGTLNTNDQDLICGYLRSEGNAVRTLRLGASEVNVTRSTIVPFPQSDPSRHYQSMRLEATNLTLEAGTSTINLRGNRVDVFLEGPGTLPFNRLLLSAPMGNSRIIPWTRTNGFDSAPDVTYTEMDLRHQTHLGGSPDIDHLILARGQRYTFASGETFTLDQLTANGDCTAGIDLSAEFTSSPTNFVSANAITADFVSIRSINASGSFTATNAVDLGDNTGWTFTEKPTEAFFWIGGTGNWNDPAHWSATSGGATSGCVPSVTDDVFFDANSFTGAAQTVSINVENAACRNMDWTGATGTPNFSGPDNHRMRVSGSLTFIPAMNHDFAGDYIFASREMGNLITSGRQPFNRSLSFDGGGEWMLADSLYVFEAINLIAGTWRTNDQDVNANFFRSRTAQNRGLFLGSSHFLLSARNMVTFYSEYTKVSRNLTFDAGTSTIEFSGGFSGNLFIDENTSLTFNVVRFSSPLGQWGNNLYDVTGPLTATIDTLIYQNSGAMSGLNTINYLSLRAGRVYEFLRGSTQTIAEMVADGNCDEGHTTLQSTSAEEPSFFELPANSIYNRLLLRNMEVTTGAPVTANNSIDGGGNSGWDISGDGSRELYWVGGAGDWFDRAHWSATSGGPGGECVPTAIDDVFFDENSSTGMPFQNIDNNSDRSATCRDLNFTAGLTTQISFRVGTVRLYGDFFNAGNINYYSSPTYFNGAEDDLSITSGGAYLGQIVFTQPGTYTIMDDLDAGEMNVQSGTLTFANQLNTMSRIVTIRGTLPRTMNLGDAHIILDGATFGFREALSLYTGSNLTINPGNSLIEFTHPTARLRADIPVELNNILFSNPAANAVVISDNPAVDALTANSLTFNGNGRIDLELTTDTLICAAGKSYVFAADKTQRINSYWQIIGNNCTPISLTSSTPGQAAMVSVPASGEILADFIQMRDITGVGGADFLAGARSTNIDNSNANWVFETAPEFQEVGFLGQDRALCSGEDLTLNAYNFSPGERYRWQDGSTDSTFVTNQSGVYFVEVTFQTDCVIRDTIEVLDAQAFSVDLPDDPVICAGDTLTFDVDAGINSADYRWQDGSEETSFRAFAPGEYFVVVDLGGCIETDTTTLTVTDLPTLNLGQDQTACVGENFTLTATVNAETFRWQDGSGDAMFSGDQAGTYWVEARNGNCPVRDSVMVTYVDPGTVDLGPDTTVCAADQLTLDALVTGFNYTWQDGSNGQTFTATSSGRYFVEIETSGCTAADTIEVVFPDLPQLDVAPAYEACLTETLRIRAEVPADAYRWSNGQNGPDFSTTTPGNYQVIATFGPCEVADDFSVDFLAPPTVNLGADVTECSGIPVVLTIPQSGTWQDGTEANTFTVTTEGRYRVEVFNGPCSAADSVEVDFLPLPEFSLGEDRTGCAGDPLTVSVPQNLGLIFWDDGADVAQRSFTEAGIRWVEIEDDNGCVGRDSVELFYNAYPTLSLGPDTTVCDDRPFTLTASSSGGALRWPDGSTGPDFAVDPGPGRAFLVAELTENNCLTLDTVVVTFEECIDYQAYLPTAFSPNFDGVNDDFTALFDPRLEIQAFNLRVYSRWGEELFISQDPELRWDGTARGQAVPTGVYLYFIELTVRDDRGVRTEMIKGEVSLLR